MDILLKLFPEMVSNIEVTTLHSADTWQTAEINPP